MKKAILSILAIASLTLSDYNGQGVTGVIFFDDTKGPSGNVFINGVLDSETDINAELLYLTGGSYQPVVTLLLSDSVTTAPPYLVPYGAMEPAAGDITANSSGQLYDASSIEYYDPVNPAGTVETFEVEGWLGNYNSYAAAQNVGALTGITSPFQDALTPFYNPQYANISNMGTLDLVPEPATLTLAGLGLGMFLNFRRKY